MTIIILLSMNYCISTFDNLKAFLFFFQFLGQAVKMR